MPPNGPWAQPPKRNNRTVIGLSVALAVIVIGALLVGTRAPRSNLSFGTGARTGDRSVETGGPSVPPTGPRTVDDLVRALDPDGSRELAQLPLEASSSNQSSYTGDAPGYVRGTTIENPDGTYRVSIETFDSPEDAQAFNQRDTRRIMDEHSTITRWNSTVAGATAFMCGCGNAYETFTRGDLRVVIYVNSQHDDPPGEADRAAEIVDRSLAQGTPPT